MTSKDGLKDIAADLREDARQIRCSREMALHMTPQPTLRGRFLDEIFEAYAQRIDAAARRFNERYPEWKEDAKRTR